MPPFAPQGPFRGVKPFEASGTGLPKRRGPQGQENRGDAGLGGGLQLPQLQLPSLQLPKLGAMQIPAMGQDLAPDVDDSAPFTAVPFPERPKVEHTKTVSGWFKNFARDVEDFFVALPASVKVAWQSGSEIVKNYEWLDDLVRNPELLTRELDKTTRTVLKGMVEHYDQGFGEALYKHPFSVMLDILTVFDLAGGALKASGKAAMKLGAKEGAQITKLGQSIQGYPGRMLKKPFEMTARALEKTPYIGDLLRAKALTPLGKELNNLHGSLKLEFNKRAANIYNQMVRTRVPKQYRELFEEVLDGYRPVSEIQGDKRLFDRANEWKRIVKDNETDLLDLGFMDEQRLERARLQQVALQMHKKGDFAGELYKIDDKGVSISDEAIEAAREWVTARGTEPVYRPFQTERTIQGSFDELFESLRRGESDPHAVGYYNRFEHRTGQNAYVHDPDVWQARSMLNKAALDANLSFINQVTTKFGKPVKGVKADAGYRILPPYMKRYIENDIVNAQTMLLQQVNDARRALKMAGEADDGKAIFQGIKRTKEELEATVDAIQADMKAALDDPKNSLVQVPEEAAYLMDKMMSGPRGFWRFYDNVLDTWRDMILTFMPRYYVNNLIGNASLLFFGGYNPFGKRAAMDPKDLPGEAIQSMLAAEGGSASSYLARPWADAQRPLRRMAEKMAEVSDTRARQLFLSTAGKEILEREKILDNTTAKALIAQESATDAVGILMKARNEFLGAPLEELRETRKILRETDSQNDLIQASMQGKTGKVYQLRAKAMPDTVRTPADSTMKEIANLQTQITREKALSNLDPSKAEGRIAELKAQMEQAVARLEQQTGKTLAENFGSKVYELPDIARLSEIQARKAALQPYADIGDKVVSRMEGFFGNYGRLHPIEREYIRRVIPFWTFSKTIFQLAYQLPFLRTKQSFLWHQFAKMMVDSVGDDRLPNRYRNYLPIGGDEEGNIVFLNLKNINPFESATKFSSVGGVKGIPQFLDPRNNPMVKVGVESIGGYDLFAEKPMVGPTQFVSLNGTVWELDPDTNTLEAIIPQKPIIDSLFQQIPHMRILGEVLEASGFTRVGAALQTKAPPINPDGTLTYDRSYMHAISRAAGFPVSVQDPERVKAQHQLLKKGMARRFRSAAGRVDPETRLQLESILRDLERAEVWE
jgi:hypothetical protein